MKSKKKSKKYKLIQRSLIIAVFFLFFGFVSQAQAFTSDVIRGSINLFTNGIWVLLLSIMNEVLAALGAFLSMMINFLGSVLKYDAFRSSEEVIIGWRIVRDTINSFFIVVLIAIAIATIIRWKPFDFRTALPRFILAAVIVNFSRTICLLAIGFSQVVMKTFADELSGALPAFIIGLRIPSSVALSDASLGSLATGETDKPAIQWATILLTQVFGAVLIALTIAGIFFFVALLLIRIIVLWMLMILSPIAFFLWGIPGRGQSYYEKWKDEFIKQIIVGPVIAFFLYIIILFFTRNATSNYGFVVTGNQSALGSPLSSPRYLFAFIVSFAMMLIALEIIKEIGARGTGAALGLTKKTAGFLGSTLKKGLSAADKLAYGANIPFLPTYTGAKTALDTLRQSTSARLDSAVERGKAARIRQAERQEGGPAGLRSLVGQLTGGNVEAIKNLSLIKGEGSLLSRTRNLAAIGPQLTAPAYQRMSDDQLRTTHDGIANREAALKYGENVSANVAGTLYTDIDAKREDIDTAIEQLRTNSAVEQERAESMKQLLPQLQQVEALEAQDTLTEEQQAQVSDFRNEYGFESSQDIQQQISEATLNIEEMQQNETQLQKDNQDLKDGKELLEKAGAANANLSINQNLGDIAAEARNKKDAEEKGKVVGALRQRTIRKAQAGSGFKKEMREKEKKYRETMYDKEEKYPVDTLAANAMSNFNSGNVSELSADLMKAAEQGALDNVMLKLDSKYTMDDKGIADFHSDLQTKSGMSSSEAGELLNRLQGRNWADRKAVQSVMVEMDVSGDFKPVSKTKRNKTIQRNIENNIRSVLEKGQHDGIGVKSPQTGKYELHDAALDAFKNRVGELENALADKRLSLSTDTLNMIQSNADAIGLQPQARANLSQKLRKTTT